MATPSQIDPAGIRKLQADFYKCLKQRVPNYVISAISAIESHKSAQQGNTQDALAWASLLATRWYRAILPCLTHYLDLSYRAGQFAAARQLKIPKPKQTAETTGETPKEEKDDREQIEREKQSQAKSTNLIKLAIFRLAMKQYEKYASKKQQIDTKADENELSDSIKTTLAAVSTTESLRQKVAGAVSEAIRQGVEKAEVKAEYMTMRDGKVCMRCKALDGQILSLDDIQNLIPQHPNCRCFFKLIPKDA